MIAVFLFLLLIFELLQQAALLNFMLLLNILEILNIWFSKFWRKNCISLYFWALFSWKLCKAFRTAQCKETRLVKPCLNSDLFFISKTSGTALLETIVFYKLLSSLSQENRKTFPVGLLDTSTTWQPECLSFPRFWTVARQIRK